MAKRKGRPPTAVAAGRSIDTGAARLGAGQEALYWEQILAKSGANIVGEVLANQGMFYEWNHYPPGDVLDQESGSQWYYHAHPKEERPGEHGHFHTFWRQDQRIVHLVAVACDQEGKATWLFTTNRWVTGESWAPAVEVVEHVGRFDVALARPSWPVNRWLGALVRFYAPNIADLLLQRDAAVREWQRGHPDGDVYEDRRLEVTSRQRIDLGRDVAALAAGDVRRLSGGSGQPV